MGKRKRPGKYWAEVLLSNLVDVRTQMAIGHSAENSKMDKFTSFLGSPPMIAILSAYYQEQ